jgi:flavorubredoxin
LRYVKTLLSVDWHNDEVDLGSSQLKIVNSPNLHIPSA